MLIVKSINQRIELFQQPIPITGLVSKLLTFPKLRVAFEIEIENCPKLLTVALSVIKVDLTHGIPMKDVSFTSNQISQDQASCTTACISFKLLVSK